MTQAPLLSGDNRPARVPIVAAARRCFRRLGVDKTRMEHVAAEAQLSRQSVYRYVSGRDELVELALLERLREFSEELRPAEPVDVDRLPDELVDLMIASVRIGREDDEFRYLTEAIPESRLVPLTTSPHSPAHELVLYTFSPILKAARAAQTLRPGASDSEIVEWLQGLMLVLAPRVDLDEIAQRRRLELFVAPALFLGA